MSIDRKHRELPIERRSNLSLQMLIQEGYLEIRRSAGEQTPNMILLAIVFCPTSSAARYEVLVELQSAPSHPKHGGRASQRFLEGTRPFLRLLQRD